LILNAQSADVKLQDLTAWQEKWLILAAIDPCWQGMGSSVLATERSEANKKIAMKIAVSDRHCGCRLVEKLFRNSDARNRSP
jgi:hypothetical protein